MSGQEREKAEAQGARLLLVEDDASTRALVALKLRQHGYEVDEAEDGEDALAHLEFDDYDLIISDVLMPRLDGFSLARAVRQDSRFAAIPILFFTAHYLEDEDELLAYRLGVDCYLRKPVDDGLLLRTIRDLLARKGLQREIGEMVGVLHDASLPEHQARTLNQLVRKLRALEESERRNDLQRGRYVNMLAAAPDAVVVCDGGGEIVEVNQAALEMTGYSQAELVGQPLEMLVPEDQRELHVAHRQALVASARTLLHKPRQQRFRIRCKDGSTLPVEINVGVCRKDGEVIATAVVRDVSGAIEAETRLRLYREALESCSDGVLIADAGQAGQPVVYVNPALCAMTGRAAADLTGRPLAELLSGSASISAETLAEVGRSGRPLAIQIEGVRSDGDPWCADVHLAPVARDEGSLHLVGVVRDVTETMRYQQELARLANYDELTGLANRHLLRDRIQQAMAGADRNGHRVALLFLDLDRFKLINDSLGHAVGDKVIQTIAQRLCGHLRRADTVARWGGDEFVFLLTEIREQRDVVAVAEQLLASVSLPVSVAGKQFVLAGSIGICFYPDDGDDVDTLLRRADAAMYEAKGRQGNQYHFYEARLNDEVDRRLHMEMELRDALSRGELVVHYQPQFDTRSGSMVGVEALVRWVRADGTLLPDHFIPLAEQTGLIEPLGLWVLRRACRDYSGWPVTPGQLRVAVNIAYPQIAHDHFVRQVREVLAETGLPPEALELELTERVVLGAGGKVEGTLAALRELGVGLSLDDFGTGYSSLSYLQRYPFDTLKIDRSFVMRLEAEQSSRALCEAIVSMSRALQLEVVAEGVESSGQSELLKSMHCYRQQGYLFGRPVEGDKLFSKPG